MRTFSGKTTIMAGILLLALTGAAVLFAADQAPQADAGKAGGEELAPLHIELPRAQFIGTPRNIPPSPHLEPYSTTPRPPFMAPANVTNVAKGKRVTSSDKVPIIGDLEQITDGDKEASDGSFVELGPGLQWVQIDLESEHEIYAVLVWHYHAEQRVYRSVVVRVADDPDFLTNVRTVFNNDYDNSSGLGVGKDKQYIEDNQGKLIDAKGVKARYVRLYSNGNTSGDLNHYIEVEVYGRPPAN